MYVITNILFIKEQKAEISEATVVSYGLCTIFLCVVPLLILSFVMLIFTIYSLFKDYTVAMACEEAHLWAFVVTCICV